ncbi:MAG TPA: sialate O-acetylesterase [Pedobacter sp.]|uniref:sialate O-acetylesterase n=1 Tax=Pedobacter sp. TaxID=1411316 RepID=UPI002C73C0DD|nr:sialate O-acetylesterase [Pedobacter sp.]HMI01574.1 sialate O-acetylesterase [Pedobacter sp.]
MKKTIYLLLPICFAAHLVMARQTSLKVADILQSNMVVQQNKPFKVWGRAVAGSVITIKADWTATSTQVTAAGDGSFMAIVNVPQVVPGNFTKHKITVKNNTAEVVLEDILIGEVWICSGQSNMQFKLSEDKNAATELPLANNPNIRVFNAELNFSAEPIQNIKGKWLPCTTENVKNFTAVGYYFGKLLQERLNLPVGIIFSGIGASKVEAFIPRDVLSANPLLDSVYLKLYLNSPKSKEVINGGFSFEKVTRPFLLYNALINPLINLSVKGFCWYQGEGNRMERHTYTLATQSMIKSWRKNFGQGDLPFYYVQVAPFFYDKEDPTLNDYAFFREAQEKVSEINNTAMIVSMDVGEAKDLHPKNKKPLGLRLAKTALNRTYGIDSVSYLGPHYHHIAIKGKEVTVFFDEKTINSGLSTNDHQAPSFFTLAGSDGVFYDARAVIDGKTIKVVSAKVKRPVAVRYAFTNYPVTNLQNNNGIPAFPFRSDRWPERK